MILGVAAIHSARLGLRSPECCMFSRAAGVGPGELPGEDSNLGAEDI